MATTKKVTRVSGGSSESNNTFVPTAEAKGRASKLRLFSILLWILAIGAEVGAIILLLKATFPLDKATWIWLIALIVVDFILVVIGSTLWKKANRLDPASKKDSARFFIQNQLGVIISVIAFLPLVILIFTNKDLDGKSKGILGGIAALLMIIGGLYSADFNPPSVEEYTQQTNQVVELTGQNFVYWTKHGTRFHLYDDCSHINTNRTDEISEGTVAAARELKNITELCKTCENRAVKANALNAAGQKSMELGTESEHDHDHSESD